MRVSQSRPHMPRELRARHAVPGAAQQHQAGHEYADTVPHPVARSCRRRESAVSSVVAIRLKTSTLREHRQNQFGHWEVHATILQRSCHRDTR